MTARPPDANAKASRANRLFLYGPFALAGALLLIWFYVWRNGAAAIEKSLAEFVQAQEGVTITYAPVVFRGFPFFLRGAAADFSISGDVGRYDCAKLYIDAQPFGRNRVIFSCGGEQTIRYADALWRIDAPQARASIDKDPARAWIARLDSGAASATTGAAAVSVSSFILNAAPSIEDPELTDVSFRMLEFANAKGDRAWRLARFDAAASLAPRSGGQRRITLAGADIATADGYLFATGWIAARDGALKDGRLDARLENPTAIAQTLAEAGLLPRSADQKANAMTALDLLAHNANLADGANGVAAQSIEIDGGVARLGDVVIAVWKKDQP